ncbi:2OG-Fe(II) oxygenase [Moritella viscosa]|uniref:Putative prolyl 4-hydroxylase, alpha subunit domain n=1 Tax=Moritella viscosa TaxID=80854 RepID=A0A1L0BS64_9GAMM|nr:2OG-Fe(II) oxygenase [Moritella viscosa]SGZ08786.1 Putative prolyl 4-hydroxylase, alpha subunit domain [Moritella viscosa]SHO10642.1 Putative prolyl 4-hydroxylase, alpha subunit domain [Moritella viscosa]SHO10643.1 Putative prolyl 4-hydroxylase, alpha subunit domain [Moritella viscosa]SHO15807.1 Putative prolyl 4-hydroxylase, alpha subunit domain [Moritella viscosa]SHO17572.1 Putative prolyl 4-hydroxylase, alpha subunit domain [Moritella viscosa]
MAYHLLVYYTNVETTQLRAKNNFRTTIDAILDNIHKHGYAVIEDALPEGIIEKLLTDCLENQPEFKAAGIGRQQDSQLNTQIRKDKTLWLTGESPAQADFMALMSDLRLEVNRNFFLGLFDYECHYAKYEIGDFYKKHLDAFKGKSNRVFTTVCYLNTPGVGGELLIYAQDSNDVIVRIAPKTGTLVVFESERFPHEVLAAKSTRYSIAGWFRMNNSIAGTIDPTS